MITGHAEFSKAASLMALRDLFFNVGLPIYGGEDEQWDLRRFEICGVFPSFWRKLEFGSFAGKLSAVAYLEFGAKIQ